jgi:CheY-like chemotaxis protein
MSLISENISIIMIEDDDGHAKLIEKNLRRAGIANEITHLNTGAKGVEFLFNNKDMEGEQMLVLLDLNLPEVDGYEILERLKTEEITKNLPVIVLTTTDNPKEINRCYDLGCNVYITKPVEYESFSAAIQKFGLMLSVVRLPNHK